MEKKNPEVRYAYKAIAALIGGIAVLEMLAPRGETISEGVDSIMESKVGKFAVHALVWSTALHLTNIMPEKYDWLHRITTK